MSRLKIALEDNLSKIVARIGEIEKEYPDIIRVKSYSRDYSANKTDYQDFGEVSGEYSNLLKNRLQVCAELDVLEGNSGGTSYAAFGAQ